MTKTQKIIYYVLNVLLTAVFLFAAYPKLVAAPEAIQGFAVAGLPVWFMYLIGAFEVLGAIGLWMRKTAPLSACGLIIIMIAAVIITAIFVSVTMAIMPLVVGIVLVIQLWLGTKHAASAPVAAPAMS